jgi:hypothetical protein|nr:DUF6384 family protein [Neorhizobium tomejilense]
MAHDPGPLRGKHDPSLSDTILAMDIADTIRRDERLRDFEMADGDRREAFIVRLREAYAAQGDVVSDEVLNKAIAKMNEDRYVHRQVVTGLSGLLWGAYIKRASHARKALFASVAATVVTLGAVAGYDQFVTKPRLENERKFALQVEEILPRDLKAAVEYARSYADRLDDKAAISRIEERKFSVETALVAKDVAAARNGIALIHAVGEELLHREEAAAKVAAEAKRREYEEKRKAETSARLIPQVATMTSSLLAEVKDAKAKAALSEISAQMMEAAIEGSESAFQARYDRFKSFAGYIRSPYTIQIVSRNGIQTGFARKHDQTGNKTWYLVVEAISPTGVAYPLEITDKLVSGPKKSTTVWAVRVSESAINSVKRDKQDGVLDNNIAGAKPAGTLDIDWKIDAYDGQTLNTW